MTKLFLHFGTHKTGSTSIQKSLSDLNTQNWRLIRLGRSANESHNLRSAFENSETTRDSLNEGSKIQELYKVNLGQQPIHPNNLISGEALESFSKDAFTAAFRFFSVQNFDVRFIGYLRNLNDSVNSRFQQRLKGSPLFALKKNEWVGRLASCMPRYQQMLERLDASVPHQNIRLFAFDPRSFPAQNVVVDFCLRLGIDADHNKFKSANQSLSVVGTKVLWILAQQKDKDIGSRSNWKSLVSNVIEDFSNADSFALDTSCLQTKLNELKSLHGEIDERLEKHRPFSLFEIKPPKDSSCLICCADQLLKLNKEEKDIVRSKIKTSTGAPHISITGVDLALSYARQVIANSD